MRWVRGEESEWFLLENSKRTILELGDDGRTILKRMLKK
jgi:hypothetical protein